MTRSHSFGTSVHWAILLLCLGCGAVDGSFAPGGGPGGAGAGPVVGGGAGGSSAGGGAPLATWRDQTLAGQLIVESVELAPGAGPWVAYRFDLRTGARAKLPLSTGSNPQETWGNNGTVAWRYDNVTARLTIFTWPDLQVQREVTLPRGISPGELELSRDARYLVSSWYDESNGESVVSRTLAVFDAATGQVVERGSQQPDAYGTGHSAAWLPDGRYIYLVGKTVWVTTPNVSGESVLFEMSGLPDNGLTSTSPASLVVSPDGSKVALSWLEPRNGNGDHNVWVVNLDGSGLHRLTRAPSPNDPLKFIIGSPTWSPDGLYVAAVRYMSGVTTQPVFPDAPFGGSRVVGSTGCIDEVLVLPVDSVDAAISWPDWDPRFGVKVAAPTGANGQWLSTCGGRVSWR